MISPHGRKRKWPSTVEWSSLLIVNILIFAAKVRTANAQIDAQLDYTCDTQSDECPTQNDGVCDSLLGEASLTTLILPECASGDCQDCNAVTCQQFQYDCQACVGTTGCFWCPIDGTCQNSNLYSSTVNENKTTISGCIDPADFVMAVSPAMEDRNATIYSLCQAPDTFLFRYVIPYVITLTDHVAVLDSALFQFPWMLVSKLTDYCLFLVFVASMISRDPLVPSQQWIFDFINVEAVWEEGFTGQGIRVRINDLGVNIGYGSEWLLEDDSRFDATAGCPIYEPFDNDDTNSIHGIQVASLIGASGNNGYCGVGVASSVTISSCNVHAVPSSETLSSNASYFDFDLEKFDISQNSLGILGCSSAIAGSMSTSSSSPVSTSPPLSDSSSPSGANNSPNIRTRRQERKKRRFLQEKETTEEEEEGDVKSSCPFLSDSPPCQACDFSTPSGTTDSTALATCEQAITKYCRQQQSTHDGTEADSLVCREYPDLLMRLLPMAQIGNGTCDYHQLPSLIEDAIVNGINNGRAGIGIIYVVAAMGDDNLKLDDAEDINFSALTHSRYTITVGAVGRDELPLSNSTIGATSALLVVAPGGDEQSVISRPVMDLSVGGCTAPPFGNSFAPAVVSGIIALMLEATPELTWRDVQGILVETSRAIPTNASVTPADKDEASDIVDRTRTVNQAGWMHSNFYGFGMIDAGAAVEAAKTWELYCPEVTLVAESGLINANLMPNVDGPETTSTIVKSTILQEDDDDVQFIVESVVVVLDVLHFSHGEWKVALTSPSGTESILLSPGQHPETIQSIERWKLLTVKNWGESVVGNWTLSVIKIPEDAIVEEENVQEECVDAPYEHRYLGTEFTCSYLEEQGFCFDGSPDPSTLGSEQNVDLLLFEFEGFTLEDACCACGGGFTTSRKADQLTQWRLVIYGRYKDCTDEVTLPSMAPSEDTKKTPAVPKKDTALTLEVEKDPEARLATILATVAAFLLTGICLYGGLRNPRDQTLEKEKSNETADFFHDEHTTRKPSWWQMSLSRRR